MHTKRSFILKSLITLLCMALLCSGLVACGNDQKDEPKDESVPATYTASMYRIDDWKVKNEDDTKDYYMTFLLHSEDYYDEPDVDDIKYLTENGYEPISEAIEGIEIKLYTMNSTSKKGICSYLKIKTNKLIDAQKIYALLEGPVEYDETLKNHEEYKEKYGDDVAWGALMINYTTHNIPTTTVSAVSPRDGEGVFFLSDGQSSSYYYNMTGDIVINENKMLKKVEVEQLSEVGIESLSETLKYALPAQMVNGELQRMDNLNDNLQICCEIVDGCLWLGFETVDGSDIDDYKDALPYALVFMSNNKLHVFKIVK